MCYRVNNGRRMEVKLSYSTSIPQQPAANSHAHISAEQSFFLVEQFKSSRGNFSGNLNCKLPQRNSTLANVRTYIYTKDTRYQYSAIADCWLLVTCHRLLAIATECGLTLMYLRAGWRHCGYNRKPSIVGTSLA